MKDIIFMHIPRAGGGTFAGRIISLIGKQVPGWTKYKYHTRNAEHKLFIGDTSVYVPVSTGHFNCVHGHFPYHESYKKSFLCTMVRDPVKRRLSKYTYHMTYSKNKDITYMDSITGNLPNIPGIDWNNMQTLFFNGATVDDFDFIGIMERYEESVELFFRKLGLKNTMKKEWYKSRNKEGEEWYTNQSKFIYTPTDEETEIVRERNSKDIDLYNKALEKFERELKG